jgi:DNA-nicking Smr family endonuclease
MSRRGEEDERAERLWRRATGDVAPLPERPARVERRPRRAGGAATGGAAPRFEVESYGEHVDGWSGKAGEEALRRIHRGEWPADLRLDLHGHGAEEARQEVRAVLRRALRAGLGGVLIVHGRGVGSEGGPVLKGSLPAWLAEPPHGSRILAYSSAGPHGGRGGATLVALRR